MCKTRLEGNSGVCRILIFVKFRKNIRNHEFVVFTKIQIVPKTWKHDYVQLKMYFKHRRYHTIWMFKEKVAIFNKNSNSCITAVYTIKILVIFKHVVLINLSNQTFPSCCFYSIIIVHQHLTFGSMRSSSVNY